MGLLDGFSDFIKTPEGQGLLSAAFGGLAGARRGAPLNSIGNAGLAGLQGYAGALDRGQQDARFAQQQKVQDQGLQMGQMQMDEMTRKAEAAKREQAWRSGLPAAMDAKVYGAGDEGPTMAPDAAGLNRYLLSPDSPFADKILEQKLFPRQAEGFTLGEGQVRYGGNGQIVAQGPSKEVQDPEQIRLLKTIYGNGTPAYKAALLKFGDKTTSHQPAVNVSYGAPQAGVDDAGNPVFFQPSKDGGKPSIVQGVVPPKNSGDKMTEDQAKAAGWLAQAENAFQNMQAAKKEDPGAVTPGIPDAIAAIPSMGATGAIANGMRSEARQKYMQAASSLTEAALRAATGAGMNVYEAQQKIKEFTPGFMDSDGVIKQKEAAIKVFIESLRPRATGKQGAPAPAANEASDPLGIRKR